MFRQGFQFGKAVFHVLAGLVQLLNLLHDIRFGRGSGALGQGADQRLDAALAFSQLFFQGQQLCVVSLPIAADGLLRLSQEVGKEAPVFGQFFDFGDHLCVQCVAVGIFHLAAGALAPLLGRAHIGIDQLAVRRMAVGQLGAHIVAAVTTDQKPGQ